MDRENLTIEEQLELEYIDTWWERKREKRQKKLERNRTRMTHLANACGFIGAAVAELVLVFKEK